MARMQRETDLCGARAPFLGCEVGSPLNNFLAGHGGERAIVFLDELDKARKEVWETLLILFGEGGSCPQFESLLGCDTDIWRIG